MSDGTLLDDGTVEGLLEGCSDGMPEGLGVGMEDGSLEAVVATGSVTVGGSTTAVMFIQKEKLLVDVEEKLMN